MDAVALLISGLSIAINLIFGLIAFTWREAMTEIRRRIDAVEHESGESAAKIVALDERSKGVAMALDRIEKSMVPRAEWETRHTATDAMLARILERLDVRH